MEMNRLENDHPVGLVDRSFDRAWCRPVNLKLYGADAGVETLLPGSPEWQEVVEQLIARLQKELFSLSTPPVRGRRTRPEDVRRLRDKLRDLYAIEAHCAI